MEVSLGEFTLFSGVINSNRKRICINDTFEPGRKELVIKVWDLSDDPNYDNSEFRKFVELISDPVVYDMKICYDSYCGVTFLVPNTGFTFSFKTKYTDSVDVVLGNKSISLSGNNISVFLNGSGVLKVIARNKYKTKVYEYGEIKALEVGRVSFFEPGEGRVGVNPEFATTLLTISSAALGVYLGSRLEDYIRSVILRFVPVSSDFWKRRIVELKDGVVSLTSVGKRYIERIKMLFSLREIYTKLKEISGNAWRNLLELFNSFKTKAFSVFYEFKYKDLYARYGFDFVEGLRRRYGERAIEVLRLGLEDKEFIEWVLENRLEGYGKDLKYLYGIYREVPRDLFGYAIKILKYTGRRDFLRFLLRNNLLKEVGSLGERGIRNALSIYSMGEDEFLRVYRRFGISGIRNALIGRSVHRYSVTSVRVISIEEKVLDDWDKTVYVVRDLERGSSEIKVVEKDVKIETEVVVYPRKVSNNIEYEDYRNMITLERIPENQMNFWERAVYVWSTGHSENWVDDLIENAHWVVAGAGITLSILAAPFTGGGSLTAIPWILGGAFLAEEIQDYVQTTSNVGLLAYGIYTGDEKLIEDSSLVLGTSLLFPAFEGFFRRIGKRIAKKLGEIPILNRAFRKLKGVLEEGYYFVLDKTTRSVSREVLDEVEEKIGRRLTRKERYYLKKLITMVGKGKALEIIEWLGTENLSMKLKRFMKIIDRYPEIMRNIEVIMGFIDNILNDPVHLKWLRETIYKWSKKVFDNEKIALKIAKDLKLRKGGKEYILELILNAWNDEIGRDLSLLAKFMKIKGFEKKVKEIIKKYIKKEPLQEGLLFEIDFAEDLIKEGKIIKEWDVPGIGDFVVEDKGKIVIYECKAKYALTKEELYKIIERSDKAKEIYRNSDYLIVFKHPPEEQVEEFLKRKGLKFIIKG